jgi:hypothetical protein
LPVANDQICFTIASALAPVDNRRTCFDTRTPVTRRFFIDALCDALFAFAKALEQTMKRATALFVAMNQRVNVLVAYALGTGDERASCDLLRTPRAAKLLDDPFSRLRLTETRLLR